ncbi:murein biosynthesis integral membrane protein MurJ [Streptodolium elevatio]
MPRVATRAAGRRAPGRAPALSPAPEAADGTAADLQAADSSAAVREPSSGRGRDLSPTGAGMSAVRGGANLAAGSVVSRLTGFVRSAIIVAALGTGLFADGYNVANTVPNILYILLVGGALNSVLVPELVRAARRDRDGGAAYTDRLVTAVCCLLLALTAVTVAGAPWIVSAYAHFEGPQRELTVTLARYCLPQIFFYGLFALLSEVLNARGRPGPAAWTPILNNVVVIAVFAGYLKIAHGANDAGEVDADQVRLLGIGTTLGIAVQALTLWPYLRAAGVRLRPRFDWRGHGLGAPLRMAGWAVALVAVSQVAYWLTTRLATTVAERADRAGIGHGVGYTAYANAQLLWIVPHGIITVSLATMLMPRISRAAAEGDRGQVWAYVARGLCFNALAIVPCAFFFLALGPQLTAVVFQHGATSAADTRAMGLMLCAFAPGLVAYSAGYLIQKGHFALQDPRVPRRATVTTAVAGSVLSVAAYLLMPLAWAVTAMAGAYSAAQVIGLRHPAARFRRALKDVDAAPVLKVHVAVTLAAGTAAGASFLLARFTARVWSDGPLASGLVLLGATAVFAALVVPTALRLMRRPDARGGRRRARGRSK